MREAHAVGRADDRADLGTDHRADLRVDDLTADLAVALHGLHWDLDRVHKGAEPVHDQPPHDGLDAAGAGLARFLYEDRYTGHTAALPRGPPHRDRLALERYLSTLEAANPSVGVREPGWSLVDKQDEHVLVGKGDERRILREDNYDEANEQIVHDRHSRDLQPGWMYFLGDTPGDPIPPLMRVYWNLSAEAAPRLVHDLADALNAAAVPFRLKLVQEPQHLRRADGAVLYIPLKHWDAAKDPVHAVQRRLALYLRPTRPLFTRTVHHGVALAVANDLDSHGMTLCTAIARAVHAARSTDVDAVLTHLRPLLTDAGVDPDLPHGVSEAML